MRLLSVAEMKALEAAADAAGHSYARMMELTGQGVARTILKRLSNIKGKRILVLVGPGNNGGDGLVAGRYLMDAGATVTAYLSRPRDPREDPVFQKATEKGLTVLIAEGDPEGTELRRLASQAEIIVDALLGTGTTLPLQGAVAQILTRVQEALRPRNNDQPLSLTGLPEPIIPRSCIVAVDGPSGMDFDSGALDPLALPAAFTITFAAPKTGHFKTPAAAAAGELIVCNIGIPEGVGPEPSGPEVVTPEMVRAWLPPRPLDSHKGTFGHAMVVAGSTNYTGAAALAALATVRAGAGLVTLGIAGSIQPLVAPAVPEATYLLLPHSLGSLTADAVPLLREGLHHIDALLIGPGLGQATETFAFFSALLGLRTERRGIGFLTTPANGMAAPASHAPLPPLIIDADGLNLLSQLPEGPKMLPPGSILTPHPGEMARLCHCERAEIQNRRVETARTQAAAWGQIIVLKGAYTVIAAPDGRTAILPFANPGLASGGTGDVLAGTITALRAQGLPPYQAAVAGAYLHALAGEIVRHDLGTAGIAAGDIAQALPLARRRISG